MTLQQIIAEDVRGQRKLWVVFWLYGVLLSHVLFGLILYLYRSMTTATLTLALLAFLAYTAWIMRAVFVNAFNVDKEIHGHIARALTVAWSINAALVSGFLLLGHVGLVTVPF